MPTHFKTLGPFELGTTSAPLEAKQLKQFWKSRDVGLSDAIGIYVLTVGSENGMRPVYIGKAEHGFRSRLKPSHDAFRKARQLYPDELLSILLIARVSTVRAEFVRKRKKDEGLKSIKDLEILLSRDCLSKGFELLNSKEKTFFQGLRVPGYLHDEGMKREVGARCLHKLLSKDSKQKVLIRPEA